MIEHIFNSVIAIFGRRGSGKSEFVLGNPDHNIPGIIPLYPAKGMKVLIVDTIDHPSYRHIPVIKKEQIPSWKKGVYRIWVPSQEMPELNLFLNKYISNCLLLYEDAYKHQYEELDRPIIELIGDSKAKNIDIIFMYHLWAHGPKDLYRYLDFIEIFKTKDTPEARKKDMVGYYNDAMQIHKQVMAHASPFHHQSLNTEL